MTVNIDHLQPISAELCHGAKYLKYGNGRQIFPLPNLENETLPVNVNIALHILLHQDGKPNYATEIKTLEEEGAIPLEQLLASLPSELLKKDWMVTGADKTKEETIARDHNGASSCGEETESTAGRIETAIGVEEQERLVNW